jgi:hypothetical protein
VAGVREAQHLLRQVERQEHHRHEHPVFGDLRERAVDALDDPPRVRLHRRREADLAGHPGHEERAGDGLARHVADHHREARRVEPEEVVEVPADVEGRLVVHREVEPRHLRRLAGQQVALDLPGEAQVVVEALAGEQAVVQPDEVQRDAGLAGEALEQVEVVLGEVPEGRLRVDVQDAQVLAAEGQRRPHAPPHGPLLQRRHRPVGIGRSSGFLMTSVSIGPMGVSVVARSSTECPWRSTRSTTCWEMSMVGWAPGVSRPLRRRAACVRSCRERWSKVTAATAEACGNTSRSIPQTFSRSALASSVLATVSEIRYIAWSLRSSLAGSMGRPEGLLPVPGTRPCFRLSPRCATSIMLSVCSAVSWVMRTEVLSACATMSSLRSMRKRDAPISTSSPCRSRELPWMRRPLTKDPLQLPRSSRA